MIKLEQIYAILNEIQTPHNGFNLRKIDNVYWGKGTRGEIVFGLDVINTKIVPMIQSTKHLKLYLNSIFDINNGATVASKSMSLLVLQTPNEKYIDIFIRLTTTFSYEATEEELLKYFLNIKELFSSERRMSYIDLQGFYGELLVMYLLKVDCDKDISRFYQVEEKRKFDFSISQNKKLDVKTTLKPNRTHHFLQEQLNTQRYDIRVLSVMLLKDDQGMSLKKLMEKCKKLFADNLHLAIHIERVIKGSNEDELDNIKFNYDYSKANFKVFDANIIPRLHEKTAEGVFNVEYDSDLTNTASTTISNFINWIES